jgi:putative oxidoreductase
MPSIVMLIGRVLLSAIFIQAGFSKLMDPTATAGYFASVGIPLPGITVWLVIALEVIGGLAVLTGGYTRWAAFLLGIFSIFAAFTGHSDWSNAMDFQAFMKDLAIAGGLFYVTLHGAGIISLDTRRGVS